MSDNGHAEMTEFERVKLENFALRHNAMQNQLSINMQARGAFIRELETAHPGYRWEESESALVAIESFEDGA